MSNNLSIPQLTQGQAAPEVGVNNATGAIDAALTQTFTADCTAGNVSVTGAQFVAACKILITNVTTARTVTLPAIKKFTFIDVNSANTGVASLVVGSTTIALVAGNNYEVYTDGTTNGVTVYAGGSGPTLPADLHVFQSGTMVNSQEFYRMNVLRPFTMPVSLTGSVITAGVAATASTTLTLKQNGSSIGTAIWSVAGTIAAITFTAAVTFAAGDVFTITGPATADATLANIAFDIKASR